MGDCSIIEISPDKASIGQRLDHCLSAKRELNLSRSQIKKLIGFGNVTVNGKITEPSYKLKAGDKIRLNPPPPKTTTAAPENIPLDIIYEDEDIIVVNKPKGLVVHPAPGNYSGTLVNALLNHCRLANLGAPLRPGIVHRLDKDTSGLIVAAKNDAAYANLVKQFKDRTVNKTYVALVHGVIKNGTGVIEARIGRHPVHRKKMSVHSSTVNSREAVTHYSVIKRLKKYTLIEVVIKTGRTHQIRVHMGHIGHPIVGDKTYGKKKEEFMANGQLLHAQKLGLHHPRTNQYLEFATPQPDFLSVIKKA